MVSGEEGDCFPQVDGRVVVDASEGQVPTHDPLGLERHGRRGKHRPDENRRPSDSNPLEAVAHRARRARDLEREVRSTSAGAFRK